MGKLIEIKARCHDRAEMHRRLMELSTATPTQIHQDDTFFTCVNGRLKLRELALDRGRLIFYCRGDEVGTKQTDFVVRKTDSPSSLRECLALAHGVVGRVKKTRTVFDLGSTRAHLDQVDGLGDFLELEVVLDDDIGVAQGEALIGAVMSQLAIGRDELLAGSYLDMLQNRGVPEASS